MNTTKRIQNIVLSSLEPLAIEKIILYEIKRETIHMTTYIKTKDGIELLCPAPWNERGWGEINLAGDGCGTKKGWKIDVVPDTLLGCHIEEACNIHDILYQQGKTMEDKSNADKIFLENMIRLINGRTITWAAKLFLKSTRKKLAYLYYKAVHKFGDPAFWNKKNKNQSSG